MVGHSESEGAAVSKLVLPDKHPCAATASKVEAEFLFATEWTQGIKMISWLWLGEFYGIQTCRWQCKWNTNKSRAREEVPQGENPTPSSSWQDWQEWQNLFLYSLLIKIKWLKCSQYVDVYFIVSLSNVHIALLIKSKTSEMCVYIVRWNYDSLQASRSFLYFNLFSVMALFSYVLVLTQLQAISMAL